MGGSSGGDPARCGIVRKPKTTRQADGGFDPRSVSAVAKPIPQAPGSPRGSSPMDVSDYPSNSLIRGNKS